MIFILCIFMISSDSKRFHAFVHGVTPYYADPPIRFRGLPLQSICQKKLVRNLITTKNLQKSINFSY
jgi:hypothetical protein